MPPIFGLANRRHSVAQWRHRTLRFPQHVQRKRQVGVSVDQTFVESDRAPKAAACRPMPPLIFEAPGATVLDLFEQAVRAEPRILDCCCVAGSNDYLIRFAYQDAEDLERFHTEVLMRLPGVARSNSMQVLRTVEKTTAQAL